MIRNQILPPLSLIKPAVKENMSTNIKPVKAKRTSIAQKNPKCVTVMTLLANKLP
jgi:hypothetical protein